MKEIDPKLLELGHKICDVIGNKDIEDCDLIVDGKKYATEFVQDWEWEDEGKYSYGDCVCRIGIADKECPWKIEEGTEMDLYIKQNATRCGSYFSDYEYEYGKPYIVVPAEKIIRTWESVE